MDELPPKKSDQIADELSAKIVHGQFAPGERLRQDAIANDYAVSQVTAREALSFLTAQGLATRLPRRGVCVSDLNSAAIDEIRLMRQALEPLALAHSAAKLQSSDLSQIEDAKQNCDEAETAEEWELSNRKFHMLIGSKCNMPRLITEIANLQLLFARHFFASYADRWRPRPDPDHNAIFAALKNRDADKACAVLSRHLSRMS